MNVRKSLLTLSIAAALGVSGAVMAQQEYQQEQQQDPQQQQQQQPPEQEPIDVSDEQLDQFVEAQEAIMGIQEDFSARLENVEDPEEAQAIQAEANDEMTAAVEETGMSIEEYNEIAMAIQTDEELRNRLNEMMH